MAILCDTEPEPDSTNDGQLSDRFTAEITGHAAKSANLSERRSEASILHILNIHQSDCSGPVCILI